jgi:hypothetical protein
VQFSQYGSSDFGSNFFRAWTVRGDQLDFGWTSPEDQIATFDELVLFYQRLMTHIAVIEGDRYDILNCSANEIELRLERSNQRFTLRRQTE